ncbi:MAG TPA: CPBP family intramembrane glutamic endopeptidase [Mycobacteriales bacterium]|jgi:membrane protease YdiL (CAAX protease family)|nr:integral rane protein [Cryptosporangiaceae bacterium]HEV7756122.1 CPBP family intramembrane glutamic endopeptidase [Mycobacteriales bacterium]
MSTLPEPATTAGEQRATVPDRPVLRAEVLLVLGVSLGASAVYSLVSILGRLTAGTSLAEQNATLNGSAAPGRPWLDLTYQLLGVVFALVPALLALHLLNRTDPPALRTVGLDLREPAADVARGVALAALIGIPGLGLYLVSHALGLNATVVPAALPEVWWAIPVLVLAALQNSLLEEIVVVGYLLKRLDQLGVSRWAGVGISAVLRGSYHLYQGFGGFVGNLAMGLVFGAAYRRWGRVGPLAVAHTLLDVVAFVGYAVLRGKVSWLP